MKTFPQILWRTGAAVLLATAVVAACTPRAYAEEGLCELLGERAYITALQRDAGFTKGQVSQFMVDAIIAVRESDGLSDEWGAEQARLSDVVLNFVYEPPYLEPYFEGKAFEEACYADLRRDMH